MVRILLAIGIPFLLPLQAGMAELLRPAAPLQEFTIRKFNEQGLRAWDLTGSEAVFLPNDVVRLADLHLTILNPEPPRGDVRARSSRASVFIRFNRVEGDGFVFIEGDRFTAQGRSWEWEGNDRRIRIERETKVRFDEAINRILR